MLRMHGTLCMRPRTQTYDGGLDSFLAGESNPEEVAPTTHTIYNTSKTIKHIGPWLRILGMQIGRASRANTLRVDTDT